MSAKEAVESGTEPAEGDHDGDQRSTGETKVAEEPTPSENGTAGASSVPVPVSRPRYDWYQTSSDVYINIMVKKLKKEEISVSFGENEVTVDIHQEGGLSCSLLILLAHAVVEGKCSFKVLSSKIELKMRKAEGLQWSTLETTPRETQKDPQKAEKEEPVHHKYPSSSHYTRNWDKLVAEVKAEEKEEKPEGDAALNKLFQKIYGDGSDEVKKAMNKSFMQSGGTVLSTNWQEVGKEEVAVKPPDGMEWKKYET